MSRPIATLTTLLGALCLQLACGGGGGGSSTPPPPANPTIGTFTASASQIFRNETSQLTGVFSNGTGKIGSAGTNSSQVTASATSGTAYPVTPQSTTTYTLTVTNAANASITADATVNVETNPPSISSFTTPSAVVNMGSPAILNWTLGARTSALTLNGNSVQGMTTIGVSPARRGTYTLVASNPLGPDASATLQIAARGLDWFAGSASSVGNLDGQGAAARFSLLWYAVRDAAGSLYVTDSTNHTIRKVTSTGLVSTFVGTAGKSGSADGTGGAARFNQPRGLAIDGSGNLYVGDYGNGTLRKVTPAGVVTTLAGTAGQFGHVNGIGAAVRFGGNLQGLAVDGSGSVYVGDAGNQVIRKVLADGTTTTIAGTVGASGHQDGPAASAKFGEQVRALVLDGTGNLFIVDVSNSVLRKLVLATGEVSTLAGSPGVSGTTDGVGGAARFSWTCGMALGPDGMLYAADWSSHRIRKVNPATGEVSTLAGGSSGYQDGAAADARFTGPCALAVGADGAVYVSDWANGTIRKIAGGQVTTLAGTYFATGSTDGTLAEARFNEVDALLVDGTGGILVADAYNYKVRRISGATVSTLAGGTYGTADGTGASAQFRNLYIANMSLDSAGNLVLGDATGQTVRKVSSAGVVTTLAGLGGASGSVDGTGAAARFKSPHGTAIDNAGNVYVADTDNSAIRKVTPAGVVTTFAGQLGASGHLDGTGAAARFTGPVGIVRDAIGNLYVSDWSAHTIRKITPAGVVTTLAGMPGVAGDADGTGAAARFNSPWSLALDGAGNLFVADFANDLVRKVTPAGEVTTVVGTRGQSGTYPGPLPATLYRPSALAFTLAGDLLVGTPTGVWLVTAP